MQSHKPPVGIQIDLRSTRNLPTGDRSIAQRLASHLWTLLTCETRQTANHAHSIFAVSTVCRLSSSACKEHLAGMTSIQAQLISKTAAKKLNLPDLTSCIRSQLVQTARAVDVHCEMRMATDYQLPIYTTWIYIKVYIYIYMDNTSNRYVIQATPMDNDGCQYMQPPLTIRGDWQLADAPTRHRMVQVLTTSRIDHLSLSIDMARLTYVFGTCTYIYIYIYIYVFIHSNLV